MHVVVAHSEDVETVAAMDEVLERARAGVRPELGPPRAALLFATSGYELEGLVEAAHGAFPELPLLGCTVEGISSSALGYHEDSVALVLLCGERLRAVGGVARELSRDPRGPLAAVTEAARAATLELAEAPALCLAFSESLTVSGAEVLSGLEAGTGGSTPVLGGTSTDDLRFVRAHQFYGGDVLNDASPFLLLGGALDAGWCADSGWYPVGIEGRVSEVTGPRVHRIGDETALAFYQRYLGAKLRPSSDNPLAVYATAGGDGQFFLRAPLAVDEATGAITFLGPIPEGTSVRITETCRDDLLSAARRAAERAREGLRHPPRAALFFSCASRKHQLGTRAALELDMLHSVAGGCPTFGVYTYGEFGSLTPQGPTRFLNQSIVALLLGGA
ncbi:MAG: FIST C-terminal domain-containing protein [Planctomycetes bacterium]|nr:FIST C-terminal domain-containing protein [Planctomycetota bacterium]